MLSPAWHQTDPCYPLTLLTLGIRTCTPKVAFGGGALFTLSLRVLSVFEFLGGWGKGCGAPPASSQTQLSRKRALPRETLEKTHVIQCADIFV